VFELANGAVALSLEEVVAKFTETLLVTDTALVTSTATMFLKDLLGPRGVAISP
jgi:hypothetical protein